MESPTAVEVLRDLVAVLPPEAEAEALAALTALTEPTAAMAALEEQVALERVAAAAPRLVTGVFRVVEDDPFVAEDGRTVTGSHLEGLTDCPDCTRGTRAIAPNVLACITLPARFGTLDGQPGDIIACGKER